MSARSIFLLWVILISRSAAAAAATGKEVPRHGRISGSVRYRFELFDREGQPFTGAATAPTLNLTLGYESASFHGFSLFVQGAGVMVTGPLNYSIPTLPGQNRPDRPAILDPRGVELNQGYLRWTGHSGRLKTVATIGRQEIMLNDGRFVSTSTWRQMHENFDAARADVELPGRVSFTYAFLNRYYRVVGHSATDGKPPMHSHLMNAAWLKKSKVSLSFYGLMLDYRSPAQFTLSTRTIGFRASGPLAIDRDWSLAYAAEMANQRNSGSNPNRVNVNYYLAEAGPVWHGMGLKAGYALLGGHSATDKLTTPLAHPFNGWTELFGNNPSIGGSHGLEARYLNVGGPVAALGGALVTAYYYDYHSDSCRIHYGSEVDFSVVYRLRRISERWEVGWRFGRYRADRLFTNALRTSVYTSYAL